MKYIKYLFIYFFFFQNHKNTKYFLFYILFDSKDDDADPTIDVLNGQLATSPIPRPSPGKGQYTKLYVKLNLDRIIYNSYRVRNLFIYNSYYKLAINEPFIRVLFMNLLIVMLLMVLNIKRSIKM